MKVAGICVGAANISVVEAEYVDDRLSIVFTKRICHEGNIVNSLHNVWNELVDSDYDSIAITGRKINNLINAAWISEPEAVELAFKYVNPDKQDFDAILSMGAELFSAYILDKAGNILTVRTPGKCASGTGEFFLQQIRRMNLTLNDALSLVSSDKIYRVSGRCSVFCKSDCTHGLNKGEPIGSILSGLCEMMAKKALELLVNVSINKVMLIGGVALNKRVVNFLKEHIPCVVVPQEAGNFEAIGASIFAYNNKVKINKEDLFKQKKFFIQNNSLKELNTVSSLVEFVNIGLRAQANASDKCILGLDVGSTTTKAVILRTSDNKILASVYLRTNGNPVEASRNCLKSLLDDIKVNIEIIGLGTTGSGRQIAGLYCLTTGVINEIIAHAKAASYFDNGVDTLFEIGGQDAKYTYFTNGVPSDYAMNEACSAGTGSFLEESCKETLGVELEDIAENAFKGKNPPNFNDQCAAFISSDIKTACYEGLKKEDVVAGLVYSICFNYLNRVKGNRPVGNKIFMQGGVCYNKAVPLAMAAILQKKIIVPPEPGLMGAYGVALEIKEMLKSGLIKEKQFNLKELIDRTVKHHVPFRCNGGQEKCDRGCFINRVEVAGRIHPFGGACNKYYNIQQEEGQKEVKKNLVAERQNILFSDYIKHKSHKKLKTLGINRSFLTHTLFPLYYHFFTNIGFEVVLSDSVIDEGVKKKGASFCYPAEIAHGLFQDLLNKKTDYIFLPQILELNSKSSKRQRKEEQSTCVILQAEPYYLKSGFNGIDKNKIISPVINFARGFLSAKRNFIDIAKSLGVKKKRAAKAFLFAVKNQLDFQRQIKYLGRKSLDGLKHNAKNIAVVILGRPYNSFAKESNMAIPDKFASHHVNALCFDSLDFEKESDDKYMNWASGQMILKAARFIKKHDQLFACFITNFSCGPDSFIVGQVRDIMGKKPMLILEIDSHTADAGINTRIEAFLDIVNSYRRLGKEIEHTKTFIPARCISYKKRLWVISSKRERLRLKDKRVKILIPPMGELGPQALSSVFKRIGVNSVALMPSEQISLQYGRGNTSCKECLPLILSAGGLIRYLKENPANGDCLVYFMPATGGNCRFGQYQVFLKNFIRKNQIKNLAVLAIDTQNSYVGLGVNFQKLALKAIVVSDIMHDIKNALLVLSKDKEHAIGVFNREWNKILHCLENEPAALEKRLTFTASTLSRLPLKDNLSNVKQVAIMGEIYARRDDFCTSVIIERLSQKGFIVKTAPILEWIYYVDYLVNNRLIEAKLGFRGKFEFGVKKYLQRSYERRIKNIFSKSGLYKDEMIDIEDIMRHGRNLVSEHLTGESIVVVGSALKEIKHSVCGVISIGPFACLPTRIIESILSNSMNELPFLSIETDGNPLPPVIEAKLEAFCLQADSLHREMVKVKNPHQ